MCVVYSSCLFLNSKNIFLKFYGNILKQKLQQNYLCMKACMRVHLWRRVCDIHLSSVSQRKLLNSAAVMVDKELDIVQENLLFCIFNTFDFSWEVSQSWEVFSFTEVSKELLLLLWDPCPWPAQKKPLKRLTFSQKQLAKWYFCNGLLLGFICVV